MRTASGRRSRSRSRPKRRRSPRSAERSDRQGESIMKRYVALGAVLTALGAAGTAAVQGAAAGGSAAQTKDGGLSVMPALIVHDAQPGALASMTVANRSTAPLDVTVTPRPWVQAVTGKVSPNRRATLPGVSVSQTKFTLQPGAETVVQANLTSAPSAGYLYGAMEVV